MKALLVSTPAMGHLNPLLSVGRILVSDGHEVVGLSLTYLHDRIKAIGATCRGFLPEADVRNASEQFFSDLRATLPGQSCCVWPWNVDSSISSCRNIKASKKSCGSFIIIGDHLMLGVLPMLLGPRSKRSPVALLGATYLYREMRLKGVNTTHRACP